MKKRRSESDEVIVEKVRRALALKRPRRWLMLGLAIVFLGQAAYFTLTAVKKIEALEEEQLKAGFVEGLALAVVWTTFGCLGGICLGKFLAGVGRDFRPYELLVLYHDRLRDLGQLPSRSGSVNVETCR